MRSDNKICRRFIINLTKFHLIQENLLSNFTILCEMNVFTIFISISIQITIAHKNNIFPSYSMSSFSLREKVKLYRDWKLLLFIPISNYAFAMFSFFSSFTLNQLESSSSFILNCFNDKGFCIHFFMQRIVASSTILKLVW